ncbi:MAG: YceI family protein [Candidatus Eremiobacteraeota bacterium]|nr:YceI family protein [Candidatus Eremiobacteraeota bacterium]
MNGRVRVAFAFSLACTAVAPAAAAQTVERAIDPAHSTATFAVQHVFVERVSGAIPIVAGTVVLAQGSLVPSSVTAVLDPAGVKSGDGDRDASLRSADFFDAAKFPTWTFASTKIVPSGAESFTMDGTLTIHGVAQPEQLAVTVGGTHERPIYHATGKVDRHAFGMPVTRLDPAIGNPVDVTLDVALK